MTDLLISEIVIKGWMKELAELSQKMELDRKKHDILSKKLEAVNVLRGVTEDHAIDLFSEPSDKVTVNPYSTKSIMKLSPRETILYWVRRAPNEGVTITYIKECIEASGYPMDAFGKNGAYFYTLLSRLQKSGKILREGDKVVLNQHK